MVRKFKTGSQPGVCPAERVAGGIFGDLPPRDGPTVILKKIKATVLKSTGQLPRMREKLYELKLVAVYDARRVGYRDQCMRTIHTLPG